MSNTAILALLIGIPVLLNISRLPAVSCSFRKAFTHSAPPLIESLFPAVVPETVGKELDPDADTAGRAGSVQ